MPVGVTVSTFFGGGGVVVVIVVVVVVGVDVVGVARKRACTDWARSSVTVQGPVPPHAPLQPVNSDPPPAVAISLTLVPCSKPASHVAPQRIPPG